MGGNVRLQWPQANRAFPISSHSRSRHDPGHPEAAAGEWRGGGTGKVVKEQQALFQLDAAHPELPGVGWPLPRPTAFVAM